MRFFNTVWAHLLPVILIPVSLSAQVQLPANLFPDSDHAPFLWGVASGDPLPDGIIIWTRPDPEATSGGPHTVTWQMASDAGMSQSVAAGTLTVDNSTDHCVRIEVSGLQPSTTYYYRFTAEGGGQSVVGRTRTAPIGQTTGLKLAVASCSSIYSGYFNAYRRIAERNDLDLMVHLGDYIYDFVDQDEQVRVPDPFPTVPVSEEEWRERHRFYLLDPDLRAARQMHPWAVIWDNHDYRRNPESGFDAFWEYVPRRDPHGNIGKAHRTLRYGSLVDLILIDIQKFRNIDTIAPGEASVLSDAQREWFLSELSASSAKWKVVGNQKMFGGWISEGVPSWLPIPNDGGVFDRGSWDGFMAERDTVLRFVEENGIDNLMVISGDVHMSFAMDISRSPADPNVYDPVTGDGSLGVEFIPTSISRGNFDEAGVPASLADLFANASNNINPHHRFTDFVQHGYGILHIRPDSIRAEWWYSPILNMAENEVLGKSLTVLDGQNRWRRAAPSSVHGPVENGASPSVYVYPNPTTDIVDISVDGASGIGYRVSAHTVDGRRVLDLGVQRENQFQADLSTLPAGMYVLQLLGEGTVHRLRIIRN